MNDNCGHRLLEVKNLTTRFSVEEGSFAAVDDVSFYLDKGEVLGIVGESGSGKSVTALSLMRLIPTPLGRISSALMRFDGTDLAAQSESQMRAIRGAEISMIFQEPMTSLNPVFTIGEQLTETVRRHEKVSKRAALARALEMLDRVGIPSPRRRIDEYPHQLSGGMRQRVMIAIALACSPKLLLADEPTTALDVTIQAQIFDLLRDLQQEFNMAIIIITHDLGVIAEVVDRVVVMYAGQVVEQGPVEALFDAPLHPYTEGLLASIPSLHKERQRLLTIPGIVPSPFTLPVGCRFRPRCAYATAACATEPPLQDFGPQRVVACIRQQHLGEQLATAGAEQSAARGIGLGVSEPPAEQPDLIVVDGLVKHFPLTRGFIFSRQAGAVRAVDGVGFRIRRGETLGLVGESGCGKTTTGRLLVRLIEATAGRVQFDGTDLLSLSSAEMQAFRREMQIVFQDPFGSLDPRMSVSQIIGEPLLVHGVRQRAERMARVRELLDVTGLASYQAERFPHEFSGGQRQRIGIARALATRPRFIVCDEPVSALDVSIQAQIINLMQDLQSEFGLTYLFISHDLSVVKHICDRVAVMYLGKIVEIADRHTLYSEPRHPYTQALLASVPIADPRARREQQQRLRLIGDVPSPINPPSGCRFHTRCPHASDTCRQREPELRPRFGEREHFTACHLYD